MLMWVFGLACLGQSSYFSASDWLFFFIFWSYRFWSQVLWNPYLTKFSERSSACLLTLNSQTHLGNGNLQITYQSNAVSYLEILYVIAIFYSVPLIFLKLLYCCHLFLAQQVHLMLVSYFGILSYGEKKLKPFFKLEVVGYLNCVQISREFSAQLLNFERSLS